VPASSSKGCPGREGRDHIWFASLSSVVATRQPVLIDWCINCGEYADSKPHMVLKGERREVEDVNTPEGLL
jgi:hypothetical protein